MSVYIFFIGMIQCFVLWLLGQTGLKLQSRAAQELERCRIDPPEGWPPCALIVPVAGDHPFMEKVLRSLLEQDYPYYTTYFVTATDNDPAVPLIRKLQRQYLNVEHIIAGIAQHCGQKNYNLLSAVARIGSKADIYIFCDANHDAHPFFLRCLTAPIVRGESAFTTGYHAVDPADNGIVTLAYTLSVLFMRLLQGIPSFTQPWGGAMAMSREAFFHYDIPQMWQRNVVDDCSLAALLKKEGIRIRLCPAALLRTPASRHSLSVWRAWLERQVLFLKFCMPEQWIGLGVICAVMVLPPIWCGLACLRGIMGASGGTAPFLALCWLFAVCWIMGGWRRLLPGRTDLFRWIWAFFCASCMFAIVYIGSCFTRVLVWHNIVYHVGRGGVVEQIDRL